MTFPQYQSIIMMIAQRLNWDIVVAQSPLSSEINEDLNPLYLFGNNMTAQKEDSDRVMTVKDLDKFINMMGG